MEDAPYAVRLIIFLSYALFIPLDYCERRRQANCACQPRAQLSPIREQNMDVVRGARRTVGYLLWKYLNSTGGCTRSHTVGEGCLRLRRSRDENLRCFLEKEYRSRKGICYGLDQEKSLESRDSRARWDRSPAAGSGC